MVKSGKFGRPVKFGQQPCLFYIFPIGIKNKLNKQTAPYGEPSLLDFHCLQVYVRIYLVSEVTQLYSTVTDLGVSFLLHNRVSRVY